MPGLRIIVTSLTALSLLAGLPACSAKREHERPASVDAPVANGSVEARVRSAYEQWRGSRHRLGGKGKGGIDCSAFVQAIYKDTFGLSLPRTTKAMVNVGKSIDRSELRAGDLVFFKPDSYPRHVGIYLSAGEFVHVSARKGVMISRTDSKYWSRHFWTARRILS